MAIQKPKITGPSVAAAVGAGLASALLSLLVAHKSPLAPTLGYISPLPIMIAAIGFGPFAGLISVVVATVVLSFFDVRPTGLALITPLKMGLSDWIDLGVYTLSINLPAWVLARLAVTPVGGAAPKSNTEIKPANRPDELRLGRILVAAVGFAAIGVMLSLAAAIGQKGSFAAVMAEIVAKVQPAVKEIYAAFPNLTKSASEQNYVTWLSRTHLPSLASDRVVRFVLNLWIAARVSQASGLLATPWADIPRNARMPRPLAIVLAIALGLSFAGGLVGMVGMIASFALAMGFELQALAVIHALTRDKSFRLPLLILVYMSAWFLPLYALVGLLDSAFAFRDRETKPPPNPGPWQQPPSRNS